MSKVERLRGRPWTASCVEQVVLAVHRALKDPPETPAEEMDIRKLTKDGYTDVGQHNGGERRDVCWPLVRASLKWYMGNITNADSNFVEGMEALLCMWLLERQLELWERDEMPHDIVNALMRMLQTSAQLGCCLNFSVKEKNSYAAGCANARRKIDDGVKIRQVHLQGASLLPSPPSDGDYGHRLLHLAPPAKPLHSKLSLQEAKDRALQNLSALPTISCESTLEEITAWVSAGDLKPGDGVAALQVICRIEKFFWALCDRDLEAGMETLAREEQATQLVELMNAYRLVREGFPGGGSMKVGERSREILWVWVTYCLVHHFVLHKMYRSPGGFDGVGLPPFKAAELLVVFYEARCRGTDFKLSRDAAALLTVGPKCTKDKLMQAAGRMRQLDQGQTVLLCGSKDVADCIRRACELPVNSAITSLRVLEFALVNVIELVESGLLMWAMQGTHHALCRYSPENIVVRASSMDPYCIMNESINQSNY